MPRGDAISSICTGSLAKVGSTLVSLVSRTSSSSSNAAGTDFCLARTGPVDLMEELAGKTRLGSTGSDREEVGVGGAGLAVNLGAGFDAGLVAGLAASLDALRDGEGDAAADGVNVGAGGKGCCLSTGLE